MKYILILMIFISNIYAFDLFKENLIEKEKIDYCISKKEKISIINSIVISSKLEKRNKYNLEKDINIKRIYNHVILSYNEKGRCDIRGFIDVNAKLLTQLNKKTFSKNKETSRNIIISYILNSYLSLIKEER